MSASSTADAYGLEAIRLLAWMSHFCSGELVLLHLASGVGNVVLATPLLLALSEMGYIVDIRMDADYPETSDLFAGWSVVREVRSGSSPLSAESYSRIIPAIPPFYWRRFAHLYRSKRNVISRPSDALFSRDEQSYYLEFAWSLGYPRDRRPFPYLPLSPEPDFGITSTTIVLAPGCKTGVMAAKRWPHFRDLAGQLADVAIAGTHDDVDTLEFPSHVRSFIDRLSITETGRMIASAGMVVANDSGLGHIAAASGVPTLMLFGPTSERVLGALSPNVVVLRAGLDCEPCWQSARFAACAGAITCLRSISVDRVLCEIEKILTGSAIRADAPICRDEFPSTATLALHPRY